MKTLLGSSLRHTAAGAFALRFCWLLLSVGAFLMIASFAAAAAAGGAIFVNANSSPDNQIWMYSRTGNGQLTYVGAFDTQGTGGVELGSQGAIALASGKKYLYAVNEGSSDVTAFSVTSSGLTFISKVASGGTSPNSIAVFGNLVYVLNAQGTTANIAGFTIQSDGSLLAIANSELPLTYPSPKAVQISFTPDGTSLLVAETHANNFDLFAVGVDGVATGPTAVTSTAAGPFGFTFDNAGHLIVSDIIPAGASSYSVSGGTLQTISAYVADKGKGACWTVSTNNSTFPLQFAYISNTNSDTISGYTIGTDGTLTLVKSTGKTAILPTGAFPLDMVISSDNKYLYVLEEMLPGIAGFKLKSTGALSQIVDLRGTPTTSWGMAGY